jgi:hypothetical protein
MPCDPSGKPTNLSRLKLSFLRTTVRIGRKEGGGAQISLGTAVALLARFVELSHTFRVLRVVVI